MNIPLNIDWQQIILHVLNLVILTGGLYLILYKPVKKFMNKRQSEYADMDKQANEKLSRAEQLEKEYTDKLSEADAEILKKRAAAEKEAEAAADKRLADTETQAKQILSRARENADRERSKIVESAGTQITELAVNAAKKVISQSGQDAYDSFLSAAGENKTNE